jgi:hypothetical protein
MSKIRLQSHEDTGDIKKSKLFLLFIVRRNALSRRIVTSPQRLRICLCLQ